MQNRTPVPREERAPLSDFDVVPRKVARHDGWTPERQRAFIAALADTGSVPAACRIVNMAKSRAYALRREPGAEGFRRAWDAALDMGLQILKDEAFDRALNGQLVPVFAGGKLVGYQRKKNDRLLMFLLRHYGTDAGGRRVTIDYFSTKGGTGASAAGNDNQALTGETTAGGSVRVPLSDDRRVGPEVQAVVPSPAASGLAKTDGVMIASHSVKRTVTTGPASDLTVRDDQAAAVIAAFEGVDLDAEAQAAIVAALEACAARARATSPEEDVETAFVSIEEADDMFAGTMECGMAIEDAGDRPAGEVDWQMLDDHATLDKIDAMAARVAAATAGEAVPPFLPPPWTPDGALKRVILAGNALATLPAGGAAEAPLPPTIVAALADAVTTGGPTMIARSQARDAARRVLCAGEMAETADALAVWGAAGDEERWAVWLTGPPPDPTFLPGSTPSTHRENDVHIARDVLGNSGSCGRDAG